MELNEFLETIGALIELQTIAYQGFIERGLTESEAARNAGVLIDTILKNIGGK